MFFWKQLFRQPVKTIIMCLLLCIVSAFLCLGFGVLGSAGETLRAIDRQFVTVAYPSGGTHAVEIALDDSQMLMMWVQDYTPEVKAFVDEQIKAALYAKGVYVQQYISGYSPSLTPVTSFQEEGSYSYDLDEPHDSAILEVTVTGFGEPKEEMMGTIIGDTYEEKSSGRIYYYVYARVDRVVSMHGGYTPLPPVLEFTCLCQGQEEWEAAGIKEGGHYLIYGTNYIDLDMLERIFLASVIKCAPHEIDWANLGDVEPTPSGMMRNYHYSDEKSVLLSGEDCANINRCTLNVSSTSAIVPLSETDSVDGLLTAEPWKSWKEAVEVTNHSVPVLGTDLLESMYLFHENKAFLTRGRSFDREDYRTGNPVCIISETLAASSGLTVGDTIELSFYNSPSWEDEQAPEWFRRVHGSNVPAEAFHPEKGFSGIAKIYQIVGIYRQSELWLKNASDYSSKSSSYSFTPNTVFVPNASLEGLPTYTSDQGIFSTIVLENGSIEKLKAALTEAGLSPEALTYFDGGYSEIVETLDGFRESAKQLFYVSVLTWMAAVVVYLVLFVRHQRRSVGLMCSLGSGKRAAARFVWVISMLPVAAASVVGALVGMALMRGTLEKVFASVQDVLSTEFSSTVGGHISIESTLVSLPWMAAVAALAQALVLAAVIWLCAHALASRKPLDNIRAK